MYLMLIFRKLTSSIVYGHELKSLCIQIGKDWKIIKDPEELQVLHKFTAIGSKSVKLYSCYMLTGVTIFLAMPVFSPLLDYVIPLENATRPKALPYYAEYGVDIQTYYYPLITQAIIGGVGTQVVFVAYDLGFIMVVQHVVALFNIVNCRLSKAAEIANTMGVDKNHNVVKDHRARQHIVHAVELHKTAMTYVGVVESSYHITWLILLFLDMVMVGGGMTILLSKLDRPEESLRYAVVLCSVSIHFYYIFLSGQKIINSSESVFDSCYDLNWYNLSEESKSLIKIMLMRSFIRCELTGGKMFILCMDTYGKMMKTGFSVFTVLNS